MAPTDGPDQQSVGSKRAANVVLDIDQLALQKLAVCQRRAHLPHLDVLYMDSPEPAPAASSVQYRGIVPVGFVAHRRQRHPHVTGFHNNDR